MWNLEVCPKLVALGHVGGKISTCFLSKVVLFECCASFKFNESSSYTGWAGVLYVHFSKDYSKMNFQLTLLLILSTWKCCMGVNLLKENMLSACILGNHGNGHGFSIQHSGCRTSLCCCLALGDCRCPGCGVLSWRDTLSPWPNLIGSHCFPLRVCLYYWQLIGVYWWDLWYCKKSNNIRWIFIYHEFANFKTPHVSVTLEKCMTRMTAMAELHLSAWTWKSPLKNCLERGTFEKSTLLHTVPLFPFGKGHVVMHCWEGKTASAHQFFSWQF